MQGLSGIVLRKGLEDLLRSVSGGITRVGFVVERGSITIATTESLPVGAGMFTYIYDITDLVGAPTNSNITPQTTEVTEAGTIVESGPIIVQNANLKVQQIQEAIAPESWLINGGQGTISLNMSPDGLGPVRLIVRQTPQIHEQIQNLLRRHARITRPADLHRNKVSVCFRKLS